MPLSEARFAAQTTAGRGRLKRRDLAVVTAPHSDGRKAGNGDGRSEERPVCRSCRLQRFDRYQQKNGGLLLSPRPLNLREIDPLVAALGRA